MTESSKLDKAVFALVRHGMKKKNVVDIEASTELKKGYYNQFFLPDCVCADGNPANMFLWEGNGKDLIISFCGGGVVTSLEDCKYPISLKSLLTNQIMTYAANGLDLFYFANFFLTKNLGILSPTEENPFADWSKVFIPYVGGDFHVGTRDFPYMDIDGNEQTFHSNGYKNFLVAMKYIKDRWPNPERILITGCSAGSFGASALAGKIIDMYPDCENITVYCDSSYLKCDRWKDIAENFWGAPEEITSNIHTDDLGGDWLEALCRNYGDRAKVLYSCSTKDGVLARFTELINTGNYEVRVNRKWFKVVRDGFQDRIKRFEKEELKISYYVNEMGDPLSGGTAHCISQDKKWAGSKVKKVSPAQWVMDAVNGNTYDVGMDLLK